MAIYIGNKHVMGSTNIYIGSHNTPTIHIGSFITYPENVTYTLSSVTQHYSAGSTIYASGSNYGYITANVYAWQGGDLLWSASNQTLSVTKVSGTGFSASGTQVKADNRGTTEGASRSGVFYGYYGSAKTSNITFTQQANAITNSNYDAQNYIVDISIGSGISARGGSATVTTSASHQARNLYTSGSYSGLGTRYDTPTVTEISDPNNRYSYSNGTLSHDSMGKNTTTDSCTLRATNGTATKDASVSVSNNYSDSWNNPVVSTFAYSPTIPASGGTASPSVTATQSGTRTWDSGSSDGLSNNVFAYSYAMTASGRWTISNGTVSASTRGTVTGNTESSPTVTVTASANNKSATSTATASQQANTATYHTSGETWSPTNILNCTSDGGNYFAVGPYEYYDWYHYTSGADSIPSRHTTVATATSYTNLISWISIVSTPSYMIHLESNSTASGRSHTLTATYNGISKQVEVSQYRSPYDEYEYRINGCGINPQSIASGDSGTSKSITITAATQYKITHWKDGQTTTGGWSAYTDTNYCNARFSGSTGHWGFYNGSQTSSSPMALTYDSSGIGKIYAYATAPNNNQYDNTQNVIIVANTASTSVTLTHKGYGNVNISVSPTSGQFADTGATNTFTVTSNVSGWGVSASTNWIHTSVNGNTVSVTADSHTSTTMRSGTVSVYWNGTVYATYTVLQSAYIPPEIPGVTKLFDLTDGWIVGRVKLAVAGPRFVYTLVIARNNAGSNATFNMGGQYNVWDSAQGAMKLKNWPQSQISYTSGQQSTVYNYDTGQNVTFYGFSILSGIEATTEQSYAGISIT